MPRLSRLLIGMTVLILLAALLPSAAAQSDPGTRTIPVRGHLLLSALSPDGRTLAVFENPQVANDWEIVPEFLPIQVVDLETGAVTRLQGHSDYAAAAVFSSDSARLITHHTNGDLLIWDLTSGTVAQRILALPGPTQISLAADDATLAMRMPGMVTMIAIWDLPTAQIRQILTPRLATYGEYMALLNARPMPDAPATLTLAPDASTVFVATLFGRIWRWDVATSAGTLLVETTAPESPRIPIRALSVTADGSTLIYHDRDAALTTRLDAATGAVLETMVMTTPYPPAVTPDGQRMAWLDRETQTVTIRDTAQPDAPQTITVDSTDLSMVPTSTGPVLFLTPDGQRLIFTGFVELDAGNNAVLVIDLGA